MLLKSFEIFDFKSINKSGECFLSPRITILAGKNESGKTNILQALTKLNKDLNFEEDDKPISREESQPLVRFKFELSEEEVKQFLEESENDQILAELAKEQDEDGRKITIDVSKDVTLDGVFWRFLDRKFSEKKEQHLKKILSCNEIFNDLLKPLNIEPLYPTSDKLRDLILTEPQKKRRLIPSGIIESKIKEELSRLEKECEMEFNDFSSLDNKQNTS